MPGEFEENACVGEGVVFKGEKGACSSKGTDLARVEQETRDRSLTAVRV